MQHGDGGATNESTWSTARIRTFASHIFKKFENQDFIFSMLVFIQNQPSEPSSFRKNSSFVPTPETKSIKIQIEVETTLKIHVSILAMYAQTQFQ